MRTESAFGRSLEGIRVKPNAVMKEANEEFCGIDRPDLDHLSQLGVDEYRIALIPPDAETREHSDITSRMLVLSLTWKQLRAQPGRQSGCSQERRSACFGEIHIDFDGMEVRRSNHPVTLTAMEFKVLKFFILNPRRAISRDDLLNQVWGYNNYPYSRTVDNHIMRLRQKLEVDGSRPVHFQTVHGIGYKFVP